MKLRKIMSLTAALAVVMTCIATVFTPVASAKTVGNTFTEDFEGYTVTDTAKTTMKELIADGWYLVDDKKHLDPKNDAKTYNAISKFATVEEDANNNKHLKIVTGNDNKGFSVYGLGRLFPGQELVAKGIWDIEFRFKSTKDFYFGVNTYNGNKPQQNIISAVDGTAYMGYRDYNALYNKGNGIKQGTIDTINDAWYTVKAIVNCDEKYYSVELRDNNDNLVARRSPISFAENNTAGFFKISPLGINNLSTVYVDDISIKPAERETLIYNEDFESYPSTVKSASSGVNNKATEDISGDSYFEGYTPWRAYYYNNSKLYRDYAWATGYSNGTAAILGDAGSGLIYMPVYENLITPTTQPTRGLLKTSFKIKPTSLGTAAPKGFNVYAITNSSDSFISKSALSLTSGVDASHWYNVEMVFDVIGAKVSTVVTDLTAQKQILSTSKNIKDLNAVKGIMFAHLSGDVSLDDIKIEYVPSDINISSVKINGADATAALDFYDSTSATYDTIGDAKTVISVDYSNPTSSDKKVFLGISYFGEDGRYLGARQASENIVAGTAGTMKYTPGTLGFGAEPKKIVIYLWDDIENINPYTEPLVFD